MAGQNQKLDPLFELFEYYLVNKSYDDAKKFTKEVATDYISYLDSTPAHVPYCLRSQLIEDLEAEAHELLVKKMYGCVKAADYKNIGKVARVKGLERNLVIEFSSLTTPEKERDK